MKPIPSPEVRRRNRIALLLVIGFIPLYFGMAVLRARMMKEAQPDRADAGARAAGVIPSLDPLNGYPGEISCQRDEDCAPSHTCTHCGQCYSRQPRLDIDCKAVCLVIQACACVNHSCAALSDGGTR